jgi:hypothetical protein
MRLQILLERRGNCLVRDSWNTAAVIQKAWNAHFEWLRLEESETFMSQTVPPYVDARKEDRQNARCRTN